MTEHISPEERFERNLADDTVPDATRHHRAFHRTIVDHYASLGLEPIEGFYLKQQAQIICDELSSLKGLSF